MRLTIRIDANRIKDWDSFHSEFAKVFGFPDFYGRNMSAWVDCMTDVDDPDAGMTKVTVRKGEILSLVIENAADFKRRCPEQFAALLESAAFVNGRRIEQGEPPVLALSIDE
jgi:RNAse (barnase) inhibitor barstar